MSEEEARELARDRPLSFLRVSRAEIDLPQGTGPHTPEVYARARENFKKLINSGALRLDSGPCLYVYRQSKDNHSQVGLVALASCEEYRRHVIKRHELTRPDKEEDRARHIEALDAQTGPVFLTYRAVPSIDAIISRVTTLTPEVDFVALDGVRHSAWSIRDTLTIQALKAEFARIPVLHIADGHHRCAAAVRVYQRRRGTGNSGFFLAVIIPHNHVQILPYNRVLKDLNGRTREGLLEELDTIFTITPGVAGTPKRRGEFGLYLGGQWYTLCLRPGTADSCDPVRRLDAALLQDHVLTPLFGIDDPRTSERIGFVGGARGAAELERLVNSGQYACAFSLFPTSVDDLMAVGEADILMPPKSTWFEPKPRDAMFCHLI
jgi:uncharacterized protein (DUF1015 family)